jgi:hypothetical protein
LERCVWPSVDGVNSSFSISQKRKLEIQTAELSYDLNIQDMNSSPRDDPDSGSLEEVRRPVTRRAAAAARLPLEFDSDSDDYAPSAKRPKKSEAPEAGEAASTEFPSSRYLTIDGKIYRTLLFRSVFLFTSSAILTSTVCPR